MSLEKFLKGEPVNDRMAQLMRGEDEAEATAKEDAPRRENYADGTPLTDHDREHLRRMLTSAGWQVLLKLLDTALQRQEDAARRVSLENPLSCKDEVAVAWSELSAAMKGRREMVAVAEREVEKLKLGKNVQTSRHDMATAHRAGDETAKGESQG